MPGPLPVACANAVHLGARNHRSLPGRERPAAGVTCFGGVSVDRDAVARARLPHRAQDDRLHPVPQGFGVCVEIVIDDPAESSGVDVHCADAVLESVDFRVWGAEDRGVGEAVQNADDVGVARGWASASKEVACEKAMIDGGHRKRMRNGAKRGECQGRD
jgi:hypothetical protein